MKNKKTFQLTVCGLFAALTAGLTIFPKIPISVGGYVHLGDAVIYVCASFLPMPYAVCASVIGGCIADVASGYAVYAPFTAICKALLAVVFTGKHSKLLAKRNYIAPLIAAVITPLVYFCADSIFYGAAGAISAVIWNICQGVISAVLYYIIAASFDRLNIKKKLF